MLAQMATGLAHDYVVLQSVSVKANKSSCLMLMCHSSDRFPPVTEAGGSGSGSGAWWRIRESRVGSRRQRQSLCRMASSRATGGTHSGFEGQEDTRATQDEEQEHLGEDKLLASLAEELVWTGGDDDGGWDGASEGEEEWTELDGLDLEGVGIEILVG